MDVSHTFTTNFLLGNFHTTTIADNAFITDSFIFTAMAFIILNRTKNTFAKQTITFRLVGTIVDRFWFEHFAT